MPIDNIRIILSLGSVCVTSTYLQRNHLKKFSCPFDWVFAPMSLVEDCLRDDFVKFLDRSYYCQEVDHKGSGHLLYGRHLFNHHNPYLSDLDYNYFQRCVERFRKVLNSREPKLFLHTSVNDNYSYQNDADQIQRLTELLAKKTSNFHLLVIYCKVKGFDYDGPRIVKKLETATVSVYVLKTCIQSNGVDLGNEVDSNNYRSIINSFNFDWSNLVKSADL